MHNPVTVKSCRESETSAWKYSRHRAYRFYCRWRRDALCKWYHIHYDNHRCTHDNRRSNPRCRKIILQSSNWMFRMLQCGMLLTSDCWSAIIVTLHFFSKLRPVHTGIPAILLHQPVMRSLLCNSSVFNQNNPVRITNGTESVCNNKGSTPPLSFWASHGEFSVPSRCQPSWLLHPESGSVPRIK